MLSGGFYGCSIARIADILMPAGYHLVDIDGWDATFVHSKFAKLFEPLPDSLETAVYAGFSHRNDLHVNSETSLKCFDVDYKLRAPEELLSLVDDVKQCIMMNDKICIKDTEVKGKKFIEDEMKNSEGGLAAPRRKSDGTVHPYRFGVTGASDQYWEKLSTCND